MCHGSSSSSSRSSGRGRRSSITSRLFPSFTLFGSFLFLGIFLSALGPAVPSLSRDLDVAESSFGIGFTIRGLGYLLGSWVSSLRLSTRKANLRWINDRMIRLGLATAGMGMFALALETSKTLGSICIFCFCQGFCGGVIDAVGNVAISTVHGSDVAPWMQGLHFCFSAGALLSPAAVGQLGYRTVFLTFGLLALPTGVACCLAAPAVTTLSAPDTADGPAETSTTHYSPVDGSNEQSLPAADSVDGDCDIYDDPGFAKASTFVSEGMDGKAVGVGSMGLSSTGAAQAAAREQQRPRDKEARKDDKRQLLLFSGQGQRSERCEKVAASAGQQMKQTSPVAAANVAHDLHNDANKANEVVHSLLLADEGDTSQISDKAYGVPQDQRHWNPQLDEEVELPLQKGHQEDQSKPTSFILVALLIVFFFLYVGVEVGFGAWVAVVVLRDQLVGESGAAFMASLFWGGIAVGRLLAMPLAIRFSPDLLIRINLVGGLFSSALLLWVGRDELLWAAIGAGLFGLFMASMYPLAMSLLPSVGYVLSDKISSCFVIGGALGEILVPAVIALLLGPNNNDRGSSVRSNEEGRPSALYDICFAASCLLLAVYGTWCGLLAAAATAPPEQELPCSETTTTKSPWSDLSPSRTSHQVDDAAEGGLPC